MNFNLHSSKPIQNSWTIWSTWRRDVSIPDMENFSHEIGLSFGFIPYFFIAQTLGQIIKKYIYLHIFPQFSAVLQYW